jgi:hypothetical protein
MIQVLLADTCAAIGLLLILLSAAEDCALLPDCPHLLARPPFVGAAALLAGAPPAPARRRPMETRASPLCTGCLHGYAVTVLRTGSRLSAALGCPLYWEALARLRQLSTNVELLHFNYHDWHHIVCKISIAAIYGQPSSSGAAAALLRLIITIIIHLLSYKYYYVSL